MISLVLVEQIIWEEFWIQSQSEVVLALTITIDTTGVAVHMMPIIGYRTHVDMLSIQRCSQEFNIFLK